MSRLTIPPLVSMWQRTGEKVPSMAPHPAMKGLDISPSPEWMPHTYDGCRPSKGYDEKNSSVGLWKGWRKCVLLMLALSAEVVLVSSMHYSASFHHSIPCISFLPLFTSPCLVKGRSQNPQMRKISRFAQTSVKRKTAFALQWWASVKLIIQGKWHLIKVTLQHEQCELWEEVRPVSRLVYTLYIQKVSYRFPLK